MLISNIQPVAIFTDTIRDHELSHRSSSITAVQESGSQSESRIGHMSTTSMLIRSIDKIIYTRRLFSIGLLVDKIDYLAALPQSQFY